MPCHVPKFNWPSSVIVSHHPLATRAYSLVMGIWIEGPMREVLVCDTLTPTVGGRDRSIHRRANLRVTWVQIHFQSSFSNQRKLQLTLVPHPCAARAYSPVRFGLEPCSCLHGVSSSHMNYSRNTSTDIYVGVRDVWKTEWGVTWVIVFVDGQSGGRMLSSGFIQ